MGEGMTRGAEVVPRDPVRPVVPVPPAPSVNVVGFAEDPPICVRSPPSTKRSLESEP